jgi:diguanylate cyclase (GGDEF)-like protein
MSRTRWGAWLLAALLAGPAALPAQEAAALDPARPALSQYRIDQWQTEQGLPMDTVQTLLQARDGALWVGTGGGLARFDGLRFSTFEASNQPDMARRSVFGLFEDRQGRIWIGHSGGASYYQQGRFHAAISREGIRRVWAFAQDADGALWAAGEGGLLRWQDGRLQRFTAAEGLPTERLRGLALDRDGRLWMGGPSGGLIARFPDGRYQTWGAEQGFPAAEIRHLLADPDGGVWVATAGDGLVHVDALGRLRRIGKAQGLPSEHLTALARDASGALWIGHWGAGLSRVVNGQVASIERSRGLADDQIWSLHADREGSLWVGSWNGGLNRLRPRVFAVIGEPEGLGGDNARAVLHTRSGRVTWVASAGGGVSRIEGGRIRVLREADGLASDEASALYEDEDGAVWIGSYTAGLTRWPPAQGAKRPQRFGLEQGLPHVDVRVLLRDRQGTLWVGTKRGLARFDDARQRFEPVAGLPEESVTVLLESRDGTLWAGTSGQGLLQLQDGALRQRLGRDQGLASNWILSLHEDAQGTLWIGTNGEGLSRRGADGRIASLRPEQGLWDGVMLSLLPDRQGQFWVSSNRGFFRVAKHELEAYFAGRQERVHSVGYGPGDALRSTTFAGGLQPAGAVDAQGRVWLPSLRGVVIVDPSRLPDAGRVPLARVQEVSVRGQWQAVGERVELPAGSAPLVLRWSADSVLNAERVRFRFQMQGLSDSWIDTGKEREARFPALPPGEYQFRISSSLDGRFWQDSEPLEVRVPPLWHQSPALRIGAGLLLLLLGAGAYRARTRQLRLREAELQRLVDERTEALRRANEHLEQLSFSDSLTGLANRRRFDELLHTEWRRCARQRQPLALLVVDIDHFKAYNDTLGHSAGDEALRSVAGLIQRHGARAGELVARYGGEEFVLLLPGLGLAEARAHAERLRQACEAAALPHPASPLGPWLTLSVGAAACLPTDEARPESLFAAADAALYRAKAAGRNRVA